MVAAGRALSIPYSRHRPVEDPERVPCVFMDGALRGCEAVSSLSMKNRLRRMKEFSLSFVSSFLVMRASKHV